MKSAIYPGKENVKVLDVPNPKCGDDDILVKNIYSSICGTDVAVFNYGPGTGHRVTVGSEFGHETVSRVVEIGKKISDVKPGDRIYPYPLYAKDDPSRAGTLGGFSEYMLLPHAKINHSYYMVDEGISDKPACLIEPFTVGGRAAKQGNPKPQEKAVIFGAGTIGIAAGIMLKYLGLKDVMICDTSDFRLQIVKNLGFLVCNSFTENFMEKVRALWGDAYGIHGDTGDIDIWIDAAGADSILDEFMSHGKIGSRFVAVAVGSKERPVKLLDLTYGSQSIIGSGGYRPEDVGDVMDIMKSGRWDIASIITDMFPIARIQEALETASDSRHHLNIIISFQ